ncbi:MAG: hypothetical protein IT445_04845 [Phycisphaeraceae bacterium]|nr:hypothetical protein [Phycisphaeraceae bacterium]
MMNHRQRFLATMRYQPRDRCPLYDFSFWDETLPEWHKQGLPAWVMQQTSEQYFGTDLSLFTHSIKELNCRIDVPVGLCPLFEEQIIEDRGDYEVKRQNDGVFVLRKKYMGSIPQHEGHTLVDRASWREHYLPRLDPSHPQRYGDNFQQRIAALSSDDYPWPRFLPVGSLWGWLRNWMGVENISYVVYDDPAWFQEMVVALADCTLGVLERLFAAGVRFDAGAIWEDMCYNAGPLLSPQHFKQYLVPQYQRITSLLRKHDVDVIWVDCDGKIDELAPLWLEAGVNTMFPIEVGTWGGDPVAFRKQYGKDMLLMGGVDKHMLAAGPRKIEQEIKRLTPLVDEGGYIPMPDHRVPPDVPFENYVFYCDAIRRLWGRDTALEPIHRAPAPPSDVSGATLWKP